MIFLCYNKDKGNKGDKLMKRESSLSVEQNEEIEDKIKDIINKDLLNIDNKSITECTEFNEIIYDLV